MTDLPYPIGDYIAPDTVAEADRARWLGEIADTPNRLRAAVAGLSDSQLNTPYRPGGWTVRQVVHHLADSHMNMYVRVKLALTEDEPVIRPYDEQAWAELPEARSGPIELSLALLDALHARLVAAYEAMGPEELTRPFVHPEIGELPIEDTLSRYAWHGKHHIAHISSLGEREGW